MQQASSGEACVSGCSRSALAPSSSSARITTRLPALTNSAQFPVSAATLAKPSFENGGAVGSVQAYLRAGCPERRHPVLVGLVDQRAGIDGRGQRPELARRCRKPDR